MTPTLVAIATSVNEPAALVRMCYTNAARVNRVLKLRGRERGDDSGAASRSTTSTSPAGSSSASAPARAPGGCCAARDPASPPEAPAPRRAAAGAPCARPRGGRHRRDRVWACFHAFLRTVIFSCAAHAISVERHDQDGGHQHREQDTDDGEDDCAMPPPLPFVRRARPGHQFHQPKDSLHRSTKR